MSHPEAPLFTFEHVPSQAEFELFARVSGDDNPIHVDRAFSARTRFGRTVAHGMFLYTLIWAHIRATLPQAVARNQALKFPNPAFAGEGLRCEAFAAPLPDGGLRIEAVLRRLADGAPVCEAVTEIAGERA
jgi:acyl dehydratase